MTKQVNVGAVGVGAFMARQHLPNIKRNPNIRIHTLCDLNAELLKQRVEEYQPLHSTTDAREIFENPEIDAVLVGTRSARHAHFILMAAEYGKHIYVEKPMTMTYDETKRVLAAVKRSGITVGVGFNRRFAPSMVEAKRIFSEYREGPSNIVYRIVDDHRIRPKYIFNMDPKADGGGGHLLQEGCHTFDLLSWFLGQEPVEIYAAGPLETDNVVVIKYADDSLATMLCGGKGGIFYPKELMEVFCNSTTLAVDHFYELRLDGPCRNFIRRFPNPAKKRAPLREESMTAFYEGYFAARPAHDIVGAHAANDIPTPSIDKGHARAMQAFADAIVSGVEFSINAVDGARATVCALKAYESIRENRPIAIAPEEYGGA